ncbi:hypothetical protein RCL1_006783 [Eukaryota sp. TZLM3-RCL]
MFLELNVGGELFVSSSKTLSERNTYFPSRISSLKELSTVFVDRDPTFFRIILNFLRDGKVPLPTSPQSLKRLLNESRFFGVSDLQSVVEAALEEASRPQVYKYRVVVVDNLTASVIEATINSLAEDGFTFDPSGAFATEKENALIFRCLSNVSKIKEEPKRQVKQPVKSVRPTGAPVKKSEPPLPSSSSSSKPPSSTHTSTTASSTSSLTTIDRAARLNATPCAANMAEALCTDVRNKDTLVGNSSIAYNRNDTSKWNIVKKYIINATHHRIKYEDGWIVPSTVFLPTRYQHPIVNLPSATGQKEGSKRPRPPKTSASK